MTKGKLAGHIVALLVTIAWGTSFISTKVLMDDASLSPYEAYIYRFSIAYVFLFFITCKKIFADSLKDELLLLLCGVCGGSLFYSLENTALDYTTTGNVSLLSCLSPMVTTALMSIIFRMKIGSGLILGSIVAFIGVFCIIFGHGDGFELNPFGDILALTSSFSWAIYAVGVKSLVPKYNTFFISRKLFLYGVLTASPMLWISGGDLHFVEVVTNPYYLGNLAFLIIACSLLAYIGWNFSTKQIGPVTTNNYLYLQPPITMIAAYFLLDESITWMGYLGCVLIIGGLLISDKLKVKRRLHQVRK